MISVSRETRILSYFWRSLDTKVQIVGPLTFLRPTFCAIVDTPTFCAIVGASTSAFERRRAFADSFPGFSR
jgi:hypothetical protein